MTSRIETAAATRRALLVEAVALLDAGGPAAVTLREVGTRAGVSRGAPYGHFADKAHLLAAVAAEGWHWLGGELIALQSDSELSAAGRLRAALDAVLALNRDRPHLYLLMFSPPAADRTTVTRAAERTCDEFVAIVAGAVGARDASRHAATLLTGVHGAAGLESSGLLSTERWQTTAVELVDGLLDVVGIQRA